jgi:twinkle protein
MYNGVQQQYWTTGWPHMDKHLKVKGGQLNIVTGTPGSGKSEWVDDLMINTVHNYGAKWAVFSPENYPVKVYFRKLSEKYESMNFSEFQEATLKNSITELSNHIHLIVDNDKDDVTMEYLFERIRTLVFRKGIKAVIIDPWNEISHVMGEREDQYLSKMLRKIKRFIRKYDLSFWLVAHPKNPQRNKDGNYNKITAYDIAGGYTWNAKADNIFSVWRDRTDNKKPVEVDMLKIKYKTDGELGTCRFFYQYATGKFQSCGSSLDDLTKVEDRGGKSVNGW